MKKRTLWLDILIALILAGLAWITRAYAANTFVTWDEPAWVYRSIHFLDAQRRGDWANTLLVGHPGVITMWCGASGLTWHTWVTGAISPEQLAPILATPEFAVHDAELLRALASLLPYAKSGVAPLHAAILVAIYGLFARLTDRRYALVGALCLLLDPFYLALSRVLHIDALSAGLMLVSTLAMLVYGRHGRRRYLILSAAAGAMAALAKAYGVLVAPVVAGALAWRTWHWGRSAEPSESARPRHWLATCSQELGLWVLLAAGAALVLWPALWAAPIKTIGGIVGLSFEYATDAGDATTSFFRGEMTANPGPVFYPVAMLFRATPLALGGWVAALIGLFWPRDKIRMTWPRRAIVGLLAFCAVYLVAISLGDKKFDRYALPAMVALDLVAAIGWVSLLDTLIDLSGRTSCAIRMLPPIVLCCALIGQGIWLLIPLAPAYFLSYYNPLVGGLARAAETLPIGWGEGVERMAAHLAEHEGAKETTVATWAMAGIAPRYPGPVVPLTPQGLPQADYIVLYQGDQRTEIGQGLMVRLGEPEHVVEVGGIPYVWLYHNTDQDRLMGRIKAHLGPGEVLITNTPSWLDREGSGLPTTVIGGDSEAEIAAQLTRATAAADGLLYVSFEGIPDPQGVIARQLAQSTLDLGPLDAESPHIHRYRLVDGITFQVVKPNAMSGDASIAFGGSLVLDGVGLSAEAIEYRQSLGVALRWQVTGVLGEDYHLFAHLLDERGEKWGQRDRPIEDIDGLLTSRWAPNSTHVCRATIPLYPGIAPGEYRLVIGVYGLAGSTRLVVDAPEAEQNGTAYPVATVEVRAASVPPLPEALPVEQLSNHDLGHGIHIVGHSGSSGESRSGEALSVRLCWRCQLETDRDLVARLRLVHRTPENHVSVGAELTTEPIGAHYETSQWHKRDIFCRAYTLEVSPDAESGTYTLVVSLHPKGMPSSDEGTRLGEVIVTRTERLFETPAIDHREPYRLGTVCEFLGYNLAEDRVAPGDTIHLTLYWRALGMADRSFKVFTHLLDAKGAVRGQCDSIPMAGTHPTDRWVADEIIIDPYEITVPQDAGAGVYRLQVGMYDVASGERLPIVGDAGAAQSENRVLLNETIRIAR